MKSKTKKAPPGKAAKSKADTKTKSAASKPRPTAEQMSDKQRQELLLHHRKKLVPLLQTKKAADAAVSHAYEIAKKDGTTKKSIEISIQFMTEEGREKIQAQVQAVLDVDRYTRSGLGEQMELFAKESSEERDFEDGRLSGLEEQDPSPPEYLSDKRQKVWAKGYDQGRADLNESRLRNQMQPLASAATKVVEQAEEHREAA